MAEEKMKNYEQIAQMLANLEPSEVMQLVAASQALRNTPDLSSKEIPAKKLEELKTRYEQLASITQKRVPLKIEGELVFDLELHDYFSITNFRIEAEGLQTIPSFKNDDDDDDDDEEDLTALGLINQALGDFYGDNGLSTLLGGLQEKARKLTNEIEDLADEYDDAELFRKVQGLEPRKSPRRSRRKRRR